MQGIGISEASEPRGAREQEMMYTEWNGIGFADGLFTVQARPDWTPKDYKEREIPLPDFLVAALKKKNAQHQSKLISRPGATRPTATWVLR